MWLGFCESNINYLTISIFGGWPGPLTCQLSQQHFWQILDNDQFRGRSSGECLEYRYSDIEGRSICLGFRFEGVLIVLWLWKVWHILSSPILWICIQPYTDVFPNKMVKIYLTILKLCTECVFVCMYMIYI